MYEYAFKRIEEKYLLTEKQKNNLFKKINNFIEKDKFPKTTVHNIYFDNNNNDLIINSLEKPIFKEKIRLRSYKIPTLKDEVFLEIKTKYKGIVGKRRIKLTLEEYYNFIENNEYDKNNQILNEINYYINYYNLKPKIYIAYDRESYKGKDNEVLRITLDHNLRSRKTNLKLDYQDDGTKYFEENTYIMEIKTLGAMPLWLVKSLSELNIYPTSFSKYGKIYEKQNKKEETNYA